MSFRGSRPPGPYRGTYSGDRGGYRGRGSYQRGGYSPGNRQAPGPPDPPGRQDSDSKSGSPYKRAPGPPDPPKRNQYGEPLEGEEGGSRETRGGFRGRGFRPYYPRGGGRGYQQQESNEQEEYSQDRGRGRGRGFYRGRGRGSYEEGYQQSEEQGQEGSSEGSYRGRGYRGYNRGGWNRGRGDYYQSQDRGGYSRGRGGYRGYNQNYDRGRGGYYRGAGRGGDHDNSSYHQDPKHDYTNQKSPAGPMAAKRTRSPSLSEDSDENIPKAYRFRRRSVSSSPVKPSSSPDVPPVKKQSVMRRSFSRSPGRDSSPDGSPQRFIRTAVERAGPGEVPQKPEISREFEVQPPQGTQVPQFYVVRGRGMFRPSRGRPPFWRGRGRGGPPSGPPSGPPQYTPDTQAGEEGSEEAPQRGGFAGRPRGWVSRGRGWVSRGRGWVDRGRGWNYRGRGWVDRGRGWVDRGRGWVDRGRGWVDRGRGFRGRGWVDRGRGWVDRGRGRGWVDRGRGWVDRGRGGWVDRGRGWVDRGRGGWVDRGRGSYVGRGGGPPSNTDEKQEHNDFDMGPGWIWDDKNSCWKRKWNKDTEGETEGQPSGDQDERNNRPWQDTDDRQQWQQWDRPNQPPPGESNWDRENRKSWDDRRPEGEGNWEQNRYDSPSGNRQGDRPDWHRSEGEQYEGQWRKEDDSAGGGGDGSGEWEENGWVWDDKEQAWRTQKEDGTWEWEWEVQEEEAQEEQPKDAQQETEEDYGEWVWDEEQQAWRRARDDGTWEWEWEYQADDEETEDRTQTEETRWSADNRGREGSWDNSHGTSPRASSTDRRTQEWGSSSRASEFDYYDENDEYEKEIYHKHLKAKKALAKYQKATRQSQELSEKIEKRRRRLEEIEMKLKKHRHKKERIKRGIKGTPEGHPDSKDHTGSYQDHTGSYEDPNQHHIDYQEPSHSGAYDDHPGHPESYQDHTGPRDYHQDPSHTEESYQDPNHPGAYPDDANYEAEGYYEDYEHSVNLMGDDSQDEDREKETGEGRGRKRKRHRSDRRRSDSRSSTSSSPAKQSKSAVKDYLAFEKGEYNTDDDNVVLMTAPPEVAWVRSNHADTYFRRDKQSNNQIGTARMIELEDKFEHEIVLRSTYVRENKPKYEKPPRKSNVQFHNESDSDYSSGDEMEDGLRQEMEYELKRKMEHPERLHKELWFNEPGESNTGPMCRCSTKSRQSGIRHNIYMGDVPYPVCDPNSSNVDKLYHYRITVSPVTNFLLKAPTVIEFENNEYIFEGFSMFSHYKIDANIPACKVVRFNIEYSLHWIEEDAAENFDIRSIDLLTDFVFEEILELYDMCLRDDMGGCRKYHLMPRFARSLPDNGKEILSMDQVLTYLLKSSKPLVKESDLPALLNYPLKDWNNFVDTVRGSIAMCPGKRPSSVRIDQLDKIELRKDNLVFPKIIHFGMRPSQVCYVGNPNYNKQWKGYVKFRHLLAYKPKVTSEDKEKLKKMEHQLQNLRLHGAMKREVTTEISCEDFIKTGINADICQHALMIPVLISHLRFHKSLDHLEEKLEYKFKERLLLQYALTHPSFRYGTINYGTNPDHARNSMYNCGIRQPQFGNRQNWIRVHRKRGIHVLIRIMAKMAKKEDSVSLIDNYERLELLGDAVVEFITTTHLYFLFPHVQEGVLAVFRAAIVQNQHLTELAKKLHLQDYFLFAHGADLCHESELRRAMADCYEALMGALFIDGGIVLADRIFSLSFFTDEPDLGRIWTDLPLHPLQEDEPNGDRHWIEKSPTLQSLLEFEDRTGIQFDHIRLLARSFTRRNVGYTALTLGHNERMEFLGDTVLKLVVSEYVFKFFPEHHEGHLSLLRQCLVNSKTQAIVCEDLGMEQFFISTSPRNDSTKGNNKAKADLLEAFLGALYVDKGIEWVKTFTQVCFFPRLKEFIIFGDWNDPKSKLQQCCLLLRDPSDQYPEMPKYKVVESRGPSNNREYKVVVYFKNQRLAQAKGSTIQQAEMNAAKAAMEKKEELFPFLQYHKKFLETKFRKEDIDLLLSERTQKKRKKKRN